MDLVTATAQAGSPAVTTEVAARLLRSQLDDSQAQAAQLLRVMPPPPSVDPGRGGRVDLYA